MDGLTITKLIMTQFTPIPNDTRFHFFCNQLNKLNFQKKKKKRTDPTRNLQVKQPWELYITVVCLTVCNRVLVNLDVNFAYTMAEREEQRQCILVKTRFR